MFLTKKIYEKFVLLKLLLRLKNIRFKKFILINSILTIKK